MSEIQTTPRLSLFDIEAELLGLIDQREDALERAAGVRSPEEHVEIEKELATLNCLIREYVSKEIRKVDNIAFAVKEFEARAAARSSEAARMKASADRDAETAKRIKAMVLEVMQEFGEKKLPGRLFTITRQGNGGQQALTIVQPDLVPEAFAEVLLTLPLVAWQELTVAHPDLIPIALVKETRPDAVEIRAALGSGNGVPGCRLEPRGESIRIK